MVQWLPVAECVAHTELWNKTNCATFLAVQAIKSPNDHVRPIAIYGGTSNDSG